MFLNKKKKRFEFKKMYVIVIGIICIIGLICSYALSFMGLSGNETVTAILATALVGDGVAYMASNAFEKHSRNKFNIDENGNPRNNIEK